MVAVPFGEVPVERVCARARVEVGGDEPPGRRVKVAVGVGPVSVAGEAVALSVGAALQGLPASPGRLLLRLLGSPVPCGVTLGGLVPCGAVPLGF